VGPSCWAPWVRGKLLLFDLGFFDFRLFRRIEDLGGHFVSRLKRSSNPIIVAQNRLWRGRARPVVGKHIWAVVDALQREELDVTVEVRARRRVYAGIRPGERRRFRVVGLRDASTGEYHLYIATITAEDPPARRRHRGLRQRVAQSLLCPLADDRAHGGGARDPAQGRDLRWSAAHREPSPRY